MRERWAMVVVFIGLLSATYYVYQQVPRAFVPDEDAGYFISIIKAPPGASLEYTDKVARQAEQMIMATPEVQSVFSVVGFSFTGSAPNQGLIFTLLKPFEERTQEEQQVAGILGGFVIPFAPPGINIGTLGGFTMEILDQGGAVDIQNLGGALGAMMGAAAQSPMVTGVFSSFTANDPQLAVNIDREKAQSLGLSMNEITSAMQIYL